MESWYESLVVYTFSNLVTVWRQKNECCFKNLNDPNWLCYWILQDKYAWLKQSNLLKWEWMIYNKGVEFTNKLQLFIAHFSFTVPHSPLFMLLKLHFQYHSILSFTSHQVEQHRGTGWAEERSAGLDVTPAELPAGVCWNQVPDPGQEESHRCHSIHGQRPGRSHVSAETPLHHGGSLVCPGAQTPTSTGRELWESTLTKQMLKEDII